MKAPKLIELHPDLKKGYELCSEIGSGGNGTVCLIRSRENNSFWCYKQFSSPINRSTSKNNQKHYSINKVQITSKDGKYEIYEFIPGLTLDKVNKKYRDKPFYFFKIFYGISEAISYLHQKKNPLVHRDIKPGNIVIDIEREPHLIDFDDIVEIPTPKEINLHESYHAHGTIGFAADELLHPDPIKYVFNEKVDVFSFGATLYYYFTDSVVPKKYDHLEIDPKPAPWLNQSNSHQQTYLQWLNKMINDCTNLNRDFRPSMQSIQNDIESKAIEFFISNNDIEHLDSFKQYVDYLAIARTENVRTSNEFGSQEYLLYFINHCPPEFQQPANQISTYLFKEFRS